jgi:hypothetical protein
MLPTTKLPGRNVDVKKKKENIDQKRKFAFGVVSVLNSCTRNMANSVTRENKFQNF